jgi:hypothetical protein
VVSDSIITRGGANGITMGFGGGAGGTGGGAGKWFRSALRNGTFGGEPGDVAGIGTRGGGGSNDGRCSADKADVGRGGVAKTLPGASTDSNALYFVTDGGARTLNKPSGLLVLPAGAGGKPAPARSHALRLSFVTPSTRAMRDS